MYLYPKAVREIKNLIEDTSKWYIRRSRERFVEGNQDALKTLFYVLGETIKLIAPIAPFTSEFLYKELIGKHTDNLPESVHLTDYPEADQKFLDQYGFIEKEMSFVINICDLGNSIRTQNQIKLKQPLSKLFILNKNSELPVLTIWMKEIIKSELNVKEIIEVFEIQDNYHIIKVEDQKTKITIGLDIEINENLKKEGTTREIIRLIQSLRKKSYLNQTDKININLYLIDEYLMEVCKNNLEYIKKITNTESIEFLTQKDESLQKYDIEQKDIFIKISAV